jgi:hypothetical protein
MNEEIDKPDKEMDDQAKEAPSTPEDAMSDYQKKMKAQRERRFGVDRSIPEP